jgi:hypothetical protein
MVAFGLLVRPSQLFNPLEDANNIRVDREVAFTYGNAKKVATFLIAHNASDTPDKKR